MSDWWARKLGQQQQPAPRQDHYPPSPGYQQQPQPGQYPAQAPQGPKPQSFSEALQYAANGVLPTHGAEAIRTERNLCPSCGSTQYFSRANGGRITTMRGEAAPAPHCYTCGYNGRFTQDADHPQPRSD